MNNKEKINRYFDENNSRIESKIISMLERFIEKKTVNVLSYELPKFPYLKGRGDEFKLAELIRDEFHQNNISYKEYSKIPERPNLIGSLGKCENGVSLMLAGHMDVVPPGEGWETDPFKLVRKGNKLYGRGTSDNKGQIASILMASFILKELGIDKDLKGELQIAALSDEECTDQDGIEYGVHYLLEKKLINPTYSIIPDIGGYMKVIDVAEKGGVKIRVTATGKQAHASTPEKGINAINMLVEFLCFFNKEFKFDYTPHPLLGHPTVNVGVINGGAASNIVPGSCSVMIDMRTVPGVTIDQIEKKITNLFTKVKNANLKFEVVSASTPHSISPEISLVELIQKHGQEVLGFKPKPVGVGGGTFAKALCLNGCNAVGWGIGNEETFHVANEYIELEELVNFAKLTCLIASDLLS